jgi:hypothetical protein
MDIKKKILFFAVSSLVFLFLLSFENIKAAAPTCMVPLDASTPTPVTPPDTTPPVTPPPAGGAKELQSVELQCPSCANDQVSLSPKEGDSASKKIQLNLMGKYKVTTAEGVQSDSTDKIGQGITWTSIDETLIKVADGLVEVVGNCTDSNGCSTQVTATFKDEQGKEFKSTISILINKSIVAEKTCELIAGSANAKFSIVLARIKSFSSAEYPDPCGDTKMAWSGTTDEANNFKEEMQTHANIEFASLPSEIKNQSAIYISKKLLTSDTEQDSTCQTIGSNLVSYGFVTNGTYGRAYADGLGSGNAYYCFNEANDPDSRVITHEQFGHVLGKLVDEYYDEKQLQTRGKEIICNKPNYNCTSDPTCQKWTSLGFNGCVGGCKFATGNVFFRQAEQAVMFNCHVGVSLAPLESYVVGYRLKNFPNSPDALDETLNTGVCQ